MVAVLDGKVALVTGAGQGVGEGIALALAGAGARIMAVDKVRESVAETVAEIGRRGGTARSVVCDLKREPEIARCIASTVAAFAGLDILVNAAQEIFPGPLLGMGRADLDRGWRSGPLATFSLMTACHEHLKGGGVVVNLVSAASLRSDMQELGAYACVKASVTALTRAAACEWGPDGIRVVGLMPVAASPKFTGWQQADPDGAADFLATIPLGYVGDCENDIGPAAVFLCGPDARYVTGTTLAVDGGQAFLR